MFHVKHSIPSNKPQKSTKVYLSAVSRPINVIIYLHGHSLGPLKVYLSEECYDTVCLHIPSRTLPSSVKVYLSAVSRPINIIIYLGFADVYPTSI